MGIALDALAVFGAIAGTVAAIALAVATGGAAAPLVVAAVASTIGTVMTMEETCKLAGISISQYYRYRKYLRNEELSDEANET